MGAVVSSTNGGEGGIVADLTNPAKADWLSQHAVACNVSNQEITSLWQKFKDLGCHENGELSSETLMASANGHTMTSKIVEMMPRSKDNTLTFQTFCNMSRWLADADIDKKVRAVFQCLNKGLPIDLHVLMEILSEIYCDESKEVIERSAKVFMHQVGDMHSQTISEQQFVNWAMQLPKDTIQTIMDFKCTPNDTQRQGAGSETEANAKWEPSSKDMMKISRMASRNDWMLLANKLGFTHVDIRLITEKLPGQDMEQIQHMLSLWLQKQGEQATLSALKAAMRASGMDSIIDSLQTNA